MEFGGVNLLEVGSVVHPRIDVFLNLIRDVCQNIFEVLVDCLLLAYGWCTKK